MFDPAEIGPFERIDRVHRRSSQFARLVPRLGHQREAEKMMFQQECPRELTPNTRLL